MDIWYRDLLPAQQRVARELLGWGDVRPRVDVGAGAALRRRLEGVTAEAANLVPTGARLTLSKGALEALACDGRFLDRDAAPFAYSAAMVRGQIAHAAVTLDHAGQRRRAAGAVVQQAWDNFSQTPGAAAAFVSDLDGVQVDALFDEARRVVLEFRDVFPLLPPWVGVRAEPRLGVSLHDGRISLFGRPDFVFGGVDRRRRRMLLMDLKTGRRTVSGDRAEMRFYALLATLKYGVAPFRVATFYLDEARWDAEDVDDAMLEGAVEELAAKAPRAARLKFAPPADARLRLIPGPACRWCTRAPQCPAVRPRAAVASAA